MFTVEAFYKTYSKRLGIDLVAGAKGLKRLIKVPEVSRPGLSLAGYFKSYSTRPILVFGRLEVEFLRDLSKEVRTDRLRKLLSTLVPAIIVTNNYKPKKELLTLCEEYQVPLFRTSLATMNLLGLVTIILTDEFSPSTSVHGTLVEVFGVGLLIQGDSSVGKSEAALGLIDRGHRLISDDIVKIKFRQGNYLEGFGAELTRHHLEIRGIGIINVANLYGAICVRHSKSIDIVVELEVWDDANFYDRVGLDEKTCDILGVKLPWHVLPVKPGRDVVLLLETIALNHRLKSMGYNSAKEFNSKLLDLIATKSRRRGASKL